jgi:hypothetical protein
MLWDCNTSLQSTGIMKDGEMSNSDEDGDCPVCPKSLNNLDQDLRTRSRALYFHPVAVFDLAGIRRIHMEFLYKVVELIIDGY